MHLRVCQPVQLLFAALGAALIALFAVASVTLYAAPTDLFFSEYIEGSSNNKALEIYNGTGSSVDLTAGQYVVQMYFNGSTTAGLSISLAGTVANGDVFVLANSLASPTILATADQTSGAGFFNGDDAVVLRKGGATGTIVDVIGQVGFDPGTTWGAGLVSTLDHTLRRKGTVEAGDTNPADVFDPSLEWDGFAIDVFDGLGTFGAPEVGPTVTSSFPVDGATDFPFTANLSVTFSEPVNAAAGAFTLTCAGNPVALSVSGGPSTFTLDPGTALPNGASCTLTVVALNVTDVDANDPPDDMVANFTVGFTPFDVCTQPFTPIAQIQGSGAAAAITGTITTSGVVAGDFEGASGLSGFYMQSASGDGNPATSEGIFVYTGTANLVAAGDVVRVTGFARERFNQTAINGSNSNTAAVPAGSVIKCGTGSVGATDVALPFESATALERYEGMLIRLPQALVISEYFNYERFGEMMLGLPRDGEPRLFTPTAVVDPGADAVARAAENALRRILIDDGSGVQNPAVIPHPNGEPFSLTNRFRGGDIVQNMTGVLGYDFDVYRIQPTVPATYTPVNERPAAPGAVGGSMRVAAMNTLNFFLTLDYPTGNPLDNKCGPLQNVECRGADADQPDEFTRQRTKLLAALAGLDADVIGLNELENTAGVDPLGDTANGVVAGLNALLSPGTFAFIDTDVIGTDAIRVGLIYQPARVTPIGAFATLDSTDDPRFIDTLNRPSLAQTFESNATGARFTVVVNHLKSKGSDCIAVGDPDAGDGQGNCNLTREAAAKALVDWMATDPTGSGDADVLIVGDLNSYAKEDPITAISSGADDTAGTADDYTNLVARDLGVHAYSYLFDAHVGYLDYAIASPTLAGQATGTAEWHINADEPDLIDYDTSFKPPAIDAVFEPNQFRASDHDPVLVGLSALQFAFGGFHKLVSDAPTFNHANGGSTIPLKFSLGGNHGLAIFAEGFPQSAPIACDAGGAVLGSAEVAKTPEGNGLTYDPASGYYVFPWKTAKAWGGTCRRLTVVFADGAIHTVNVAFK